MRWAFLSTLKGGISIIHILQVDDDPLVLKAAKLFLESQYAFEVTSAASGHDAFSLFHTGRYDAIVSGYDIPEMNGITLLSAIRQSGSDIPFIVFTEKNREDVAIEALNNGADFYLQKGGNTRALYTQLANQIQQAVRRRSAEKAIIQKKKDLRHLIDASPHVAMLLNPQGEVIAINQSGIRCLKHFTEISDENIYGENAMELFPPEIAQGKLATINQAINTGEATTSEEHFRNKFFAYYVAPLFDEDDNLQHIAYFQEDITQKKHAHDLLLIQRDLGIILTEVVSLDEACIPCLDAALSIANMDTGAIHLLDESTGDLVYYYSINLSTDLCNTVSRVPADTDIIRLLKTGSSVSSDPKAFRHPFFDEIQREGLTSVITIPIFFMGELIGGISLASHAPYAPLDCQHEALEIIAAMGGNTIGRLMAEHLLDEKTLRQIPTLFPQENEDEESTREIPLLTDFPERKHPGHFNTITP